MINNIEKNEKMKKIESQRMYSFKIITILVKILVFNSQNFPYLIIKILEKKKKRHYNKRYFKSNNQI